MKHIFFWLSVFCLLFLLYGCTQTKPKKQNTPKPFKVPDPAEEIIIPFDQRVPIRRTSKHTLHLKNKYILQLHSSERVTYEI